ncbi:hypothetical protein [Aestuariivirga sp.]|uniref:hypothetical protein n=1 Tax=Aestuariivirga sp. TaxID=2650926 RepID=UPI003BAC9B5A
MRGSPGTIVLITVASALAWVASVLVHNRLLPGLFFAPGIDMIFVPSGVRLFALMVGGIWAAAGVSLGTIFLAGSEFGFKDLVHIAVLSLTAGFAPYLSLLATMRALGLTRDLKDLAPVHLPLISLGVGVGSAATHNLLFCALGIQPWSRYAPNTLTMAMGDFLGCLIAALILFAMLHFWRRRKGVRRP